MQRLDIVKSVFTVKLTYMRAKTVSSMIQKLITSVVNHRQMWFVIKKNLISVISFNLVAKGQPLMKKQN